jgi:hypothetical protein
VVDTITVGSSPFGIAATPCAPTREPVAPAPIALEATPRFTG